MARLTKNQSFEPVINAAQKWIKDCLIADNSSFSNETLWTPEHVAEVRSAFVDHPDEGKDDFNTKLKRQMAFTSPSAKRLMAEMVWALLLFPSNIKVSTKRQQVDDLWSMSGEALAKGQLLLSDDVLAGIGSGGPGFNNHRWREMVFLISLVGDLKKQPSSERQKLMSVYEAFVDWIAQVPQEGHRQFRHMLRFFCFPERVERMSSNRERWAVLAEFGVGTEKDVKKWSDRKLDEALLTLRRKLEGEHPGETLDFYDSPLRERWMPTEEDDLENASNHRFWVEKTIVKNRPDRQTGENALGKALWSPQRADDGKDIYRQMRAVRPGDVVFHFVDNESLTSFSVAQSEADESFVGVSGTAWAGRPAYRISLSHHQDLEPYIGRKEFLQEVRYRPAIDDLLAGAKGLFFNKEFNLNQGSYLTEAPLKLVQIWNDIYIKKTGKSINESWSIPPLEVTDATATTQPVVPFDNNAIEHAIEAIDATHMRIDAEFLKRFVSSLAAKPFIILTGLAGSGKTKLAQAFARWISVPTGCYDVVPVGADWTGNENVLGYPNGLDKETYISKPALDLILHAKGNPDIPHFLILDEMNLSHVERYFADILSVIESEETIQLYNGAERKANGSLIPSSIVLPRNLFIIGTVNVDETTYMFSPKVLDRANVIEFRMEAEELGSFLSNPAKPVLSKLDGKGASFGKAFVDAAKSPVDVPAEVKPAYEAEMILLFKALRAHGAEFGYRTAHEAARFVHFYKLLGNHADGDAMWFPKAFDCVVLQKLLPKLHGSRAKLGPLLKTLWFLTVNDAAGRGENALKAAAAAARSTDKKADPSGEVPAGAPYPLSAEKIGRMWRLLRDNGFASFAEA